ncbi:MAG: 3-deoxy-manno-octulosonate cytidylyltransferase [Proteobacteria bacterium]|nr:3-deoxy-manno-octulosonate cytidylyltransferase [Pseudomonadota bacterium]
MVVELFIPARFASKRLPGKPLADIGGRPMIQWVYERASKAALADKVTVATDDERIYEVVKGFGGSVVMTGEHSSGTGRVAEAVLITKSKADIIVNVQGDEPLIEPATIDAAIRPMLDDSTLQVATLKTPLTDADELNDPNAVKVVTDKEGFALYFSRSRIPYSNTDDNFKAAAPFKHIGLYVYRAGFLKTFSALDSTPLELSEGLEQLRVLENGYRIKVIETATNPISIDTEEDLLRVRRLAATLQGE